MDGEQFGDAVALAATGLNGPEKKRNLSMYDADRKMSREGVGWISRVAAGADFGRAPAKHPTTPKTEHTEAFPIQTSYV